MTVWYNSKNYCEHWWILLVIFEVYELGLKAQFAGIKLITFTCFYWFFIVEKFLNNWYKHANFIDFLCAIFWAQTVPIPPSCILQMLCNVVNFHVDFVSTLIWRYLTLRRHINLTATLKQRWIVCWVMFFVML